ncbi:hypothetical protein L1785_03325 [Antribacter sp. KLBMP9083]|uniref:Uncharacterized protein n=1 Tax=Antribacter soli TaxID=2910976 RepID=A0AA41U628_9MICO|nr:hypothetical protein [Antribacter soli]MCF4120001.1 hypothetical protein [Antribacter soli]
MTEQTVTLHLPLRSTAEVGSDGYAYPWIELLCEWFFERVGDSRAGRRVEINEA